MSPSIILLSVQLVLLAVLVFGDIGFDHPGRFGLDFNAFVVIGIAYAIAWICGFICSIAERNWLSAVLQIAVPIGVYAYENRPLPEYDAAAYQHLKGKTQPEVEALLGTRGVMTGFEGHPDGDRQFAAYRGLTIVYSPEGRVIAVIRDEK